MMSTAQMEGVLTTDEVSKLHNVTLRGILRTMQSRASTAQMEGVLTADEVSELRDVTLTGILRTCRRMSLYTAGNDWRFGASLRFLKVQECENMNWRRRKAWAMVFYSIKNVDSDATVMKVMQNRDLAGVIASYL